MSWKGINMEASLSIPRAEPLCDLDLDHRDLNFACNIPPYYFCRRYAPLKTGRRPTSYLPARQMCSHNTSHFSKGQIKNSLHNNLKTNCSLTRLIKLAKYVSISWPSSRASGTLLNSGFWTRCRSDNWNNNIRIIIPSSQLIQEKVQSYYTKTESKSFRSI